ncbi:MAG TPA: glucosamine-6-phosphate deaminase [Vicinamibacterales bacterium]|nr:glucosamine-6-phosphate deaminase [Vicinamibacterales bacterium]
MEISSFDTAEETLRAVAHRVVRSLRETPDLILGLPAGRTPVGAYAELRRMHAAGDVDFSRATSFNLDEFAGIERTHPGSFHRFMAEHLLSGVNLPARRVHSLNGGAPDLDAECERYEDQLALAGGIDLQLLGIGANGHIGFNEPGDALVSRTHRVTLLEATRRENAALFGGDPAQVPREALSMGMGTILKANTVVMIATGAGKAGSVERMVRGPIVTQLPASFLQTHRHVEVYLDRSAAARL